VTTPDATLVEQLGHPAGTRVAIISAGGLGSCHAANVGVYESLRSGIATAAALHVPCPWAREAASRYQGEDVGVALTLTAPYDLYRWGPITQVPSLYDGDGGFPRTVTDVWEHADLDEVRRECRAQVERAILWGFDVTHLASQADAMLLRPEFFDVLVELALEFGLPIRSVRSVDEQRAGFPIRRLTADEGVLMPDDSVTLRPGMSLLEVLDGLRPGVTDVVLEPAADLPELRAFAPDWSERVAHHASLLGEAAEAALRRIGAVRIGYRQLRELQRSTPRSNAPASSS
jgi:predicted glycoside hydrolase/deacetylase ChbG (UPF0249 family)